MSTPGLLEARDVWFAYDPGTPVLNSISLSIASGDFVAIIGQNGSGKTTFAKHFNGLLRPTRGQIRLDGQDIRDCPTGELARTVGYVFQNPDHQIFSATVFDEVAFGPRNLGFRANQVEQQVREALELWDLLPLAKRPPATLGFGLRRQVTLASVYAMQTPVLILDEPTTGLDWQRTRWLMEQLTRLHQVGRTILLITHDLRIVAEYVPRCILMHHGALAAYGPTRVIFQQAEQLAATKLETPQITRLAQHLRPYGMPGDILSVSEFCEAYAAILKHRSQP